MQAHASTGLIAVPAEEVMSSLKSFSERWGWPVVQDRDPAALLRRVLRHRTDVVVIQIPPPGEPGITLLEGLRGQPRRILLAAVAEEHREWLEQRVRMAGVAWYFASDADTDGLEAAVAEFLPEREGVKPSPMVRTTPRLSEARQE